MLGLHTTDSLAEYLQVSPHTVRREREAGRLPFIRIRDLVRYRPEDVETYLQSQSQDHYDARPLFGERVAAMR
ncbi:MAG TPA: helix-turn-helix domain-containing protein [Acidobacteriota bacterium]|nr:helix-turn-helix domain-containing protein [Acidobacteriota bacterium]